MGERRVAGSLLLADWAARQWERRGLGDGGWGQNNGSRSEVKAQELKLGVAELDDLSLSLSLGELEQKQAG